MATILFGWELGANLGHLIPIARIAKQLDGEGHQCFYALRSLSNARAVLGSGARILQAPLWPSHRHLGAAAGVLGSYGDILSAVGFADPMKLAAVTDAWSGLIDLIRPDVVVVDHSPALVVELHGSGTRTVAVGTGFTMPPLDYDHFPPLRGDVAPAIPEGRLFESVRDARAEKGRKRPSSLMDVFRTDHRVVFGLPELDPYKGFRKEAMAAPPGGLPPAQPWPRTRRLFVYVGADMPNFHVFLQALAMVDISLEVYLRGDADPAAEFLRMRGATVHDAPPALDHVLGAASHVLTQGGVGTISAAYSAGRPQLVVATHDETEINLDLLKRAGVGHGLKVSDDPSQVAAEIRRFVDDRSLPDNALEAANRIAKRVLPDGATVAAGAVRAALASSV